VLSSESKDQVHACGCGIGGLAAALFSVYEKHGGKGGREEEGEGG
jgi:hypothetical protein